MRVHALFSANMSTADAIDKSLQSVQLTHLDLDHFASRWAVFPRASASVSARHGRPPWSEMRPLRRAAKEILVAAVPEQLPHVAEMSPVLRVEGQPFKCSW